MKILHLMLSNYLVDGFSYQENILPVQNKKDGHDVKIIASTEVIDKDNHIYYIKPGAYINEHGLEVTRVSYKKFLPHYLMSKVRAYNNVFNLIETFKPDVILQHDVAAYELITLAKYKKKYPGVKIYMDCHTDYHNSARGFLSREFLHKRFYAPILNSVLPYVDRVLCVSLESIDFLKDIYRVPKEKMELYPLGGIMHPERMRLLWRKQIRTKLGYHDDDIIMVHSGKMNRYKKTDELITAFLEVNNRKHKLLLIGSIGDNLGAELWPIIEKESRINYLGWLDGAELMRYLCAADIYLQPGSQSSTLQNALCCGCPVMVYPFKSHEPYVKENGFFVDTKEDMINVFMEISNDPEILRTMSKSSLEVAYEMLDYRKLAARLYS